MDETKRPHHTRGMKRLFWSLFLAGCASTPIARGPQSLAVDPFVLELERVFAPHVFVLDRDLLLFRYESGVAPKSLAEVQAREIPAARRFFDTATTGGEAGPGLETATDPVAGAAEAFASPRLFAFRLRAGSRMLAGDVEDVSESERADLARLAATHGCGDAGELLTVARGLALFRNSSEAICRRALGEAFTRLRVQAISYPRYGVSLADCRTTGTGVNVVDPFALALEQINVYAPGRRLEGNAELTPGIAALFREASDDWRARMRFGNEDRSRRVGDLFRDVTALAQTREWKGRHVFKCGTKWAPEIEHPVAAMLENAQLNADVELRSRLLATAYAYMRAFPNETFEPARLRVVHETVLADLDLPADLRARWLRTIGAPPGLLAVRARALDGTRGPASLPALYASFRDTLKQMSLAEQRDPLLVARLLARSGLGPVGQRVLYNGWQLETGGVPVLKGDIPLTADADTSEWRARNRDLYLELLARCRAVYATASPDEIATGECGLVSIRE